MDWNSEIEYAIRVVIVMASAINLWLLLTCTRRLISALIRLKNNKRFIKLMTGGVSKLEGVTDLNRREGQLAMTFVAARLRAISNPVEEQLYEAVERRVELILDETEVDVNMKA